MNTVEEIQDALDALVTVMMAKGVVTPQANLSIRSHRNPTVTLWSSISKPAFGNDYLIYQNGDTTQDAIDAARAFIADMPDPETAAMHNHMRRVADCIDKGRADGIDDAYITPLVGVKNDMAKNLLGHVPQDDAKAVA